MFHLELRLDRIINLKGCIRRGDELLRAYIIVGRVGHQLIKSQKLAESYSALVRICCQ